MYLLVCNERSLEYKISLDLQTSRCLIVQFNLSTSLQSMLFVVVEAVFSFRKKLIFILGYFTEQCLCASVVSYMACVLRE